MDRQEIKKLEKTYLDNLLKGNRKACLQATRQYLQQNDNIPDLYENIFKPALYEVGRLWEQNKISVAAEHMATAITEGILNTLYADIVPDDYNGKKVVLACVEKEEHQVGIKMVADIFEMHEWESFFLGTGFPTSELISFIKVVKPDLVAISLSVYFNFANLKKMVTELKTAFPDLPLIAGGQALHHLSEDSLGTWSDVRFFPDLISLKEYIITLK